MKRLWEAPMLGDDLGVIHFSLPTLPTASAKYDVFDSSGIEDIAG